MSGPGLTTIASLACAFFTAGAPMLQGQAPCTGPRLAEPDSVLVAQLGSWTIDWQPVLAIQTELRCRGRVPTLLAAFQRPTNDIQRARILEVLYLIEDPRITTVLRSCITTDLSHESFLCTMYIARQGDTTALGLLNQNYFSYSVSSLEWSAAAELFGKFRYRPAAANLSGSLNAPSLNLVNAAYEALLRLYPDGPQAVWPPDTIKARWERYLRSLHALP